MSFQLEEHSPFSRGVGQKKTYHRRRIAVPWSHHAAEPDVPQPELPWVMESYCLSPNPNHTVDVGNGNVDGDCADHCLSAETPLALDAPECIDTSCLRGEADNR